MLCIIQVHAITINCDLHQRGTILKIDEEDQSCVNLLMSHFMIKICLIKIGPYSNIRIFYNL